MVGEIWRLDFVVHAQLQGKESGLEPVAFIDFQTKETFIDSEEVRGELGTSIEDLTSALTETIRACNY